MIPLPTTARRSFRMYDVKTVSTIRRRTFKNRTRAPARCSGVNPRRACLENHVKRSSKPTCIYGDRRRLESCSRDPIGYKGSPWNLYEYGSSRVASLVDPSGKVPISCTCQRFLGFNGIEEFNVETECDGGGMNCCSNACGDEGGAFSGDWNIVGAGPSDPAVPSSDPSDHIQSMCDRIRTFGGCGGCSGNCEQDLAALLEAADNHTATSQGVDGQCQEWAMSFSPPSSPCYSAEGVVYRYWWTGIPGTEWHLRHATIQITLCDGTAFTLDNGWWSGLNNCTWTTEGWHCVQDGNFPL